MKKLPIGKQNFEEIIENDFLYIDKTRQIYNILEKGNLYFLSRPRRFGKSLLVTIFREIFQGNKELFQKLWIGQQTDYTFDAFPILQFNFADYGRKIKNLEEILQHEITKYAQQFGIDINEVSLGNRFKSLVSGIASKGKPVVILIDEYDKPIVDFILEIDQAKTNRQILRDLFSPLKGLDSNGHLKFLFITGVSKFSRVSLFSDLNNLFDLSKSPLANDLLGITQEELEVGFKEHIDFGAKQFNLSKEQFLKTVKDWYNGYSYDGKTKLYNPFSILSFFIDFQFNNYWFETGTPTFLVETIRNHYVNPKELENFEVNDYFFSSFSLENLDVVGLLYQTGYLTIKQATYTIRGSRFVLGYPNIEVRQSMMHNLTQAYTFKHKSTISQAMVRMQRGLEEANLPLFVEQLKIVLSDISYHLHPKKSRKKLTEAEEAEQLFKMWEGYFQTIIYLVTAYMDLSVRSEVTKHKGRLDIVAETDNYIYLMELKLDETSTDAIKQIKNREYAISYKNAVKKVFLVGISFSKEERNVESWQSELWDREI